MQVEGTLSIGKRDRDLESAQTLLEKRKQHVYLEQKAESVEVSCLQAKSSRALLHSYELCKTMIIGKMTRRGHAAIATK